MAIEQSFIDELISRADIVDVVSNYVSLKKSGSNYFGLCPFHSEKSPSFSVSADKQIYHCFGCSEGGGAISFIMKIEGFTYVDAIKFLAKMYNMQVPETGYSKESTKDRETILEINKKAARFFYNNLQQEKNEIVRNYLVERHISKKISMTFGIGYANNSFNELLNFLLKEGYTKEEVIRSGLATKNEKGNIYDRFRGRVIFPIIDIRGNIIAFGGRVIDDSMPKYLNSPETLVFNKSFNLFSLNIAKKSKKGYIILAEGYMDVIALNMAGFDCAVASLGTSLTEGQARLLVRYTKDVVIAYDSDKAGQAASSRAIDILKKAGLNIKVLQMNDAKDPDEYIKKYGSSSFENLIQKSENDTQYKFDKIVSKYNLELDSDKIECIKELTKMISTLYSGIEREIFIVKSSEKTGISKEAITLEFKKYVKTVIKNKKAKEKRETMSPVGLVKPKNREIIYEDIKSARAEEEIVGLIFTDCTLLDRIEICEERFSVELFRNVYSFSKKLYDDGKQVNISYFYEILDDSEISHLASILQRPQTTVKREEMLKSCVDKINERYAYRTNDMELILELKRKSRSV